MPRNFRPNKFTGKGRSSSREETPGSSNSSRSSGGFRKSAEGENARPRLRSGTGGPFRKRDSSPDRDSRGEGDNRNSGNRNFRSSGPFRGKPDGERSGGGSFRDKKPHGKRNEGASPGRPRGFSKSPGRGGFARNRGEGDSTKPPRQGTNFGNSLSEKSYRKRSEGPTDNRKRFSASTGPGKFGDRGEKRPFRRKEDDSSFEKPKRFSKSAYGDRKEHRPLRATRPDDPQRGRNFSPGRGGDHEKQPLRKREQKSFVQSRIEKQRDQAETGPVKGTDENKGSELIRLNKFISNSGVCSRREADELIKMGLITVNGTTITEMGFKVKLTDDVRHEGKKLTAEKPVYILMNKPKGYITTTDDPQERNTVMQLIEGACKERVYPVGRLDRNTTGLLLLTNDGDLADKLTHPSYNVKKIYKVELDRPLTKADHQKITEGVQLEEGRAMVDDFAIVSDDSKTVGIELHIGWNHVVRRIFEALEYRVVKLDRVVYAGLDKQTLPRGKWRFLKEEEIIRLKHYK